MIGKIIAFLTGMVLFYLGIWTVVVLQLGHPTVSSYWVAAVHRVKAEAAKKMDSPKLIVIGGSGAHFGISARLLQEKLGLPCINLASHAALEFPYHFYRVRQIAKSGDVLLLCLEYEYYPKEESWTPRMLDLTIDTIVSRDPEYVRQLSLVDKWILANGMSNRRILQGFERPIYSDAQVDQNHTQAIYHPFYLNQNGDQTGHGPAWQRPGAEAIFNPIAIMMNGSLTADAAYPHFSEIAKWARENRIVLLVTYPNLVRLPTYSEANIDKTEEAVRAVWGKLNVPVLGSARAAMLKPEEMLDTRYHPMEEPALQRTEKLVPLLTPYIQNLKKR